MSTVNRVEQRETGQEAKTLESTPGIKSYLLLRKRASALTILRIQIHQDIQEWSIDLEDLFTEARTQAKTLFANYLKDKKNNNESDLAIPGLSSVLKGMKDKLRVPCLEGMTKVETPSIPEFWAKVNSFLEDLFEWVEEMCKNLLNETNETVLYFAVTDILEKSQELLFGLYT